MMLSALSRHTNILAVAYTLVLYLSVAMFFSSRGWDIVSVEKETNPPAEERKEKIW